MKTGIRLLLVAALGMALSPLPAGAEDKPALTDQKEKISYSIGMNIGNNLKRGGADVDVDVLAQAIKDVLAGRELRLTDQQAREAIGAYQQEMAAKQKERAAKQEEERKKPQRKIRRKAKLSWGKTRKKRASKSIA